MKKILLFFLCCVTTFLIAQNPNNWDTAWVTSFGGVSFEEGRDLKETKDKGFIIAGTTSTFGDGNTSFYIIKTDSSGNHKWSRYLGTGGNDIAYAVEIAQDNGYFFSGTSNSNIQTGYDGYLIKTDSVGNFLWSKTYGGSDWDFFYSSCMMPDGGLILCGESYSRGGSGSDAYIIRVNQNGDTLWTRTFGALSGDDCLFSVKQSGNSIFAVGKTFDAVNSKTLACIYKLDFNGNIITQNIYAGNGSENTTYYDLCITSGGDILLCGRRYTGTSQSYILRKVDSTAYNQLSYDQTNQAYYFRSIIEGYSNEIYALGQNNGGAGGTAALYNRFTSNFAYLNGANFGGVKDESPYKMIRTSRGFAFIGSTISYGNANNSVDANVYLVVFNKKWLVNDYFLVVNEFQDNLPMVGISKNKAVMLKPSVYPNPVNSVFNFSFSDYTLEGKTLKFQLFDYTGKLITDEDIIISNQHVTLNRKEISSGLYTYLLKINSNTISSGKISFE